MKETNTSETFLPDERILSRIFWVRGRKVMFDSDLAKLYGVEIRELNQAVKRNDTRFPEDFMFQLSEEEYAALRSQIVILNSSDARTSKRGLHRKYRPYAFTEQGVAMLSSVLQSERAVQVNIQIIRTFTKLREILGTHKELREKIELMESKYDKKFKAVFDVLKQLLEEKETTPPPQPIGFRVREESPLKK